MKLADIDPKGAGSAGSPGSDEAVSARVHDLETILQVTKTINRSLVLEEVLSLVVDSAVDVAKGERGMILLHQPEKGLECVVARDASGRNLPPSEVNISRTIADDVFSTGESICAENAQMDGRFDQRASVASLQLETILCSPLTLRDERIGVIYVDSRRIQPVNKDSIIYLFEILAGQAAIAIRNAQMYETVQRAYKDLQEAHDQLVKFERMVTKGEIAAEISHELKNLVQIALLQAELLAAMPDETDAATTRSKMQELYLSVKRIEIFSTGLLERAGVTTVKTPGRFNDLVRRFSELVTPLKKFKQATLNLELDPGVPMFEFDKQQMQQLLLNLVGNSVDANPDAEISIRTSFDSSRANVVLTVADNGPGIPADVLPKLFRERITTKKEGHGYGLTICKQIVESHGGTIHAESAQGKGALFILTLPAK